MWAARKWYNRLERVDALWTEVLGATTAFTNIAEGSLRRTHHRDLSRLPGFSARHVLGHVPRLLGLDLAWSRAKPGAPKPRMSRSTFYHHRGRRLTQIVRSGFQKKITGKKWAEVPLAEIR